jgi:Cd2+/Zn2+-exporting ATPase/Cu+-exporting ATPase
MFLVLGKLHQWLLPSQEALTGLILLAGALIASFPVFKDAVQGFISREINFIMEQLVSLALLAALVQGDFEIVILIPLIIAVVHFLEDRSIMGARAAIEGIKTLQAKEACLLTAAGEATVPAGSLQPGDTIRVRPGMVIPIDGEVVQGHSSVDQSSLTGETVPADVLAGDQVYAGTFNLQGLLDVRVTKKVDETSLSQIVELLKEAEQFKTPTMRLIQRYAGYYLPVVILVAVSVLFITQDMNRVIAVLVVSCPCAQLLVSSTAMISSLATASKNGVLIKGSAFLETLGKIRTIIFDKTGTLTTGKLAVSALKPAPGVETAELLAGAAIAARGSHHPVSRAIYKYAGEPDQAEAAITEAPGLGIEAKTPQGTVLLGKASWLESKGFTLPSEEDHFGPVVWVARDDKVLGRILLADTLRREAGSSVQELRGLGIKRTVLLTGDRQTVAQVIMNSLSLDHSFAECLPSDKLRVVEEEMNQAHVMVVGDGVNDALALVKADVGVAMGAMGSDIAIKSADVALMGNDLSRLGFVIRLSRQTRGIIYQNMLIASLSSVIMVAMAAGGYISPLAGTLLHNLGAFFVIFNSARLLKFE